MKINKKTKEIIYMSSLIIRELQKLLKITDRFGNIGYKLIASRSATDLIFRDLHRDLSIDKNDYLKLKVRYEKYGFKFRIGYNNKKWSKNPLDSISIYIGSAVLDNLLVRLHRSNRDNGSVVISIFGF
jgi:hypothetical protein